MKAPPNPAMPTPANAALEGEVEIRRKTEERVRELIVGLEMRLAERTYELNTANEELLRHISERRRAEQSLHESEERFHTIFNQALVGIAQTDLTGRFLNVNDCYCQALGYRREELLQKRMQDITHPEDLPGNLLQFQALAAGGPDFQIEKRYVCRNGSLIWVINRVNAIRDAAGRVLSLVAISLDVTARKRADIALRANELKFRRLLDSNILGVIFWNLEGDILDANDLFLEMVGYTREDLHAGRLNWKKLTPPESVRDDEKAVGELKARGTCTSFEKEYIRKDGSRVSVLIGSAMLEALQDTGSSFVMDITERKRAARQIEHFAELFRALSHRLLAAQEEERRHLARELHDEIGQTLTAAKLNLKAIAPDALPPIAGRIEDSIQLLDRLLGQVRQLSLDLRPPLLDELGLVPALRWLADQQTQRARLRITFSANVEGVEMDPPLRTACFRIAQEAITNAVRHAQAATVAVELRAESERVWLVVRDDGVGFDKDAMQQRAAGGASIGLLSMNERVSLWGGTGGSVRSAPGHPHPRVVSAHHAGNGVRDPKRMSVIRVLLVDDHALVRAGLRALLEKLPGIEVVGEAGNGRAALKLVETVFPNMVLLDISMAELGGLEALPRIVSDFPSVKVLILSGHANEEYVLRALHCGAAGYLLKDAAAEELELAVHAVAQGRTYLSPAVSRTVVENYLQRAAGASGPLGPLTARQREVLLLLAEGGNTKEIAHALGISVKTVETHRAQIMERLDIHEVAGLVRYAIRIGMVSTEK